MISPGGIADLIFGIGISAKQPVYFGNINAETLSVNGSGFGIIRGRSYLSQFFGKTEAADIMCAFSRFFSAVSPSGRSWRRFCSGISSAASETIFEPNKGKTALNS